MTDDRGMMDDGRWRTEGGRRRSESRRSENQKIRRLDNNQKNLDELNDPNLSNEIHVVTAKRISSGRSKRFNHSSIRPFK
jgi:hypothetical protein